MSLFTPSLDQIFARLNSGYKWPTSTITYAFTTSASQIFTRGEAPGYSSLILSAKQSAILALSLWDDLIVPNFIEVHTFFALVVAAVFTQHFAGCVYFFVVVAFF